MAVIKITGPVEITHNDKPLGTLNDMHGIDPPAVEGDHDIPTRLTGEISVSATINPEAYEPLGIIDQLVWGDRLN